MTESTKQLPGWEAHARTIGIAVTALILGYVTLAVKDMPSAIARMEVQITQLQQQVKIASESRYRATDAARDFALRDARLQELERRIQALEGTDQ